jgi:hypothetical protein
MDVFLSEHPYRTTCTEHHQIGKYAQASVFTVFSQLHYVGTIGWMDGWMDGWLDGWIDGWMGEWVNGWMDR